MWEGFQAFILVCRHCRGVHWYAVIIIYIAHLPSTPLLSHCRFTESGEEVRLWPLFPALRRGEQSLTSPHCVALVPCESWCLAVVGKQLTVTQECLLTGRSSKFKADPLPWLGKMHSIQGKGVWFASQCSLVLYLAFKDPVHVPSWLQTQQRKV